MSSKKKEKINEDIETEIKIWKSGLRKRDENLITLFDQKKVKKWHPRTQEHWLQSVYILRKRADLSMKRKLCDEDNTSELYKKRSKMLKQFSTLLIHRWRMKHHHTTAKSYIQSTARLKAQLIRCRWANCWVSMPQRFRSWSIRWHGRSKAYRRDCSCR